MRPHFDRQRQWRRLPRPPLRGREDTAWSAPRNKSTFVENRAMGLIEDFHLANVCFDHHIQRSLTQLILSGVLERHPHLKPVACEWGTAWIPMFMDNLDGTYLSWPVGLSLKRKPSEYLLESCWFSFDRELGSLLENVERLANRLMWSSDDPHIETSWPKSRDAYERACAPYGAAGPTLGATNCAELFRIPTRQDRVEPVSGYHEVSLAPTRNESAQRAAD